MREKEAILALRYAVSEDLAKVELVSKHPTLDEVISHMASVDAYLVNKQANRGHAAVRQVQEDHSR